jgi:hypothetical protein
MALNKTRWVIITSMALVFAALVVVMAVGHSSWGSHPRMVNAARSASSSGLGPNNTIWG